jgi:hypothetical protein
MQSGALTILPPKPAMPGDSLKAVAAKPVVKAAAAAAAPEVEQVVPSKPAESKELRELKAALDRLCSTRSLRRATDAKKWDSLLNGLREEARRCNALALELKETEKKLAVDCFRRQKV